MAYDHVAEDQIADALGEARAARRARADTSRDDVVLLDRRGRVLGAMGKLDAHLLGRRHLAISVLIRDGGGRLLLQQRAAGKYHSAGLWTNTCCSHPRPGEETGAAAARRLPEEMGINAVLAPLFTMHYRARVTDELIEDELVHVFGGRFDGAADPDAGEVSAWRWITYRDLRRDIAARPQAFTVWFGKFLRERAGEIERFLAA